jgi:DNA mismatch endonuclease, patch repair protein
MASIRGKDTAPEILVRKIVRTLGYSFKTHVSDLPSSPDIVLRSRRKAILVHGCFWHRHSCKFGRVLPETRAAFWRNKLFKNKDRDASKLRTLRHLGWKVLVVWECQTREPARLLRRVAEFLRA